MWVLYWGLVLLEELGLRISQLRGLSLSLFPVSLIWTSSIGSYGFGILRQWSNQKLISESSVSHRNSSFHNCVTVETRRWLRWLCWCSLTHIYNKHTQVRYFRSLCGILYQHQCRYSSISSSLTCLVDDLTDDSWCRLNRRGMCRTLQSSN